MSEGKIVVGRKSAGDRAPVNPVILAPLKIVRVGRFSAGRAGARSGFSPRLLFPV